MELAFVFLHVNCPKLDVKMSSSPPKFALEGADEGLPVGMDRFHFQCALCGQRIDVQIEDKGQAESDVPDS
jgi:hypothetical protein